MLASLAVVTAAVSDRPLLLFAARVYFPEGDKRRSHYQLYVSDLYGKHRRQLTHGSSDVTWVSWVGRAAVAWTELHGAKTVVFVSKLDPFRPRVVAKDPTRSLYEPFEAHSRRGHAVLGDWEAMRVVTLKGMSAIRADDARHLAAWEESSGKENVPDTWHFGPGRSNEVEAGQSLEGTWLRLRQGKAQISLDWKAAWASNYCLPIGRSGGKDYFGHHTGMEYHSHREDVYEVDWTKRKARVIVHDLAGIDFDPQSPFYCGSNFGGRGLIPLGEKMVWGAKLYAGNWKTGKRWLVMGGTVHVSAAKVQP